MTILFFWSHTFRFVMSCCSFIMLRFIRRFQRFALVLIFIFLRWFSFIGSTFLYFSMYLCSNVKIWKAIYYLDYTYRPEIVLSYVFTFACVIFVLSLGIIPLVFSGFFGSLTSLWDLCSLLESFGWSLEVDWPWRGNRWLLSCTENYI